MRQRLQTASRIIVGMMLTATLARAESEVGVLIMANAGPRTWTKTVTRAVREAKIPYETRLFFGPADTAVQQGRLQDAVRELESEGAHTLVVIPLEVSPFSPLFRQWKYLLGGGFQPGYSNGPLFPIQKNANVRFGEALNDSAVVVEILLDRIQEISRKPSDESVILLSAGPRDEGDAQKWMETLDRLSARIKDRGRYHDVTGAALRDDAPSDVRQASLDNLRTLVETAQSAGRHVLVVPVMLSAGGIEHKISLELRGLGYVYNNKPLMPDSRLSDWLRSQLP